MPAISERSSSLGNSPIRGLMPFANAAKKRGIHIYHMNIGQPDIETPKQALELLRSDPENIIQYGPSEGILRLREVYADYISSNSTNIHPEHVHVTVGASEAISLALLTCCNPQDEVIIPEPFYANYLGFAHQCNVRINPVSSYIEDDFRLPSIEAFEQKITAKTKAIVLCNPGNPTGQLYSKEKLQELLHLVKKHDLFLIVDEVYRAFCYDENFHSVLSFKNVDKHVIVIDSVSKLFSACGARVGFLVSRNKNFLSAVNRFAQLRLCPPYHGQQLAIACYEHGKDYIEQSIQVYNNRRQVLFNCLQDIPDIQFYKPVAAFYNLVQLPVANAFDFCKWLLSDFEYEGETLMLAPANGFYMTPKLGDQQVRIAYVLNEKDIQKGMICLKKALENYQSKH